MNAMLQQRRLDDRWWIWAQNLLTLAALVVAPVFQQRSGTGQILIGAALYLCGAIIGFLAVRDLGRNRSPHPQPLATSSLVQSGVYALMRHPLYTSLILLTVGWSIGWNSVPALAIAATLALFLDQKARVEERYLGNRYPEYGDYSARVKRFLPWIY